MRVAPIDMRCAPKTPCGSSCGAYALRPRCHMGALMAPGHLPCALMGPRSVVPFGHHAGALRTCVHRSMVCPHSPIRVLLGSSYGQDIFKPLNHVESNKDHEKKMKLACLEATMEGALRESSVASLLMKIPFEHVSKWPKSVAPTRQHHARTLGPLDHLWCALMVRYERFR